MNKIRKKILAMTLGLMSVGKNFIKESQAVTVVENKKHMPIISSNFKKFMPYIKKYARYLKFAGGATGAFFATITVKSLLGKFEKTKKQIKIVVPSIPKISLQKIDNNPFAKVIPHLVWQNSNCFFLSSLYTVFGPENYDKYKKIAKMSTKDLDKLVCNWCGDSERNDQECKDFLSLSREERLRKSAGFIELCKLYVRMKSFVPDENKSFQIIPKDFKGGEIEYENVICGCDVKSLDDKFKDRNAGGGPYKEVIKKFAGEISPFTYAIGDESIFFEWSPDWGQSPLINTNDFKVKVPLDRVLLRNKENNVVGEPIERYVEMDENGKITVDKKNYYLVSISLGEGHIYCLQPKFSIDEMSNSIKVSALLHLTCFSGKDELYSCKDINDVFKNHISRGYYFRFAPESAIRQYQDYYCMKN